MLSDKEIEQYVDAFGAFCPYCHSQDLQPGSKDHDCSRIYQQIQCLDCLKIWDDIYELVYLEEERSE